MGERSSWFVPRDLGLYSWTSAYTGSMEEHFAEEECGLKAAIDEGDADMEAGRYTDYTDDTLHRLFEHVRRRGRETLEAQDKQTR